MLFIITWIFTIFLIGLLFHPIAFILFNNTREKGICFSKIIGILLISYCSWILGYISFSRSMIFIIIILFSGISFLIIKLNYHEYITFLKSRIRLILFSEFAFLILFLGYCIITMHQPNISGTEKFGDFAYLNAIINSKSMPPYDPWLSGNQFSINYYYFGHLIMGVLTKITKIPSNISYNLSIITIPVLGGIAILGLLYNLTRRIYAGFLGILFLIILGNLDGFRQWISNGFSAEGFNWWRSSRIIEYKTYDVTINEFPFFSFLIGDLHPHYMSIPFFILNLNIGLILISNNVQSLFVKTKESITFLFFTALCLGALWFLNSWDYPTMLCIFAGAIIIKKYILIPGHKGRHKGWIQDIIKALVFIIIFSIFFYLPFTLSFSSPVKGIGYTKANTRIIDYLIIFGIMLFPIFSLLFLKIRSWFSKNSPVMEPLDDPAFNNEYNDQLIKESEVKQTESICSKCGEELRKGKKYCGFCGLKISLITVNNRFNQNIKKRKMIDEKKNNHKPVLFSDTIPLFLKQIFFDTKKRKKLICIGIITIIILLGPAFIKTIYDQNHIGSTTFILSILLLLSAIMLITRKESIETQYILLLISMGFFISLGLEFVHIKDAFGEIGKHTPLERMNSVFKYYYQIWILFSICAGYSCFWVLDSYFKDARKSIRICWISLLSIFIFSGLIYTFIAAYEKTGHFQSRASLDGTYYLKDQYPGDYEVIQKLKQINKNNAVVLESWGDDYTDYGRISSYTGFPTLLGWPGHVMQKRGTYDEPSKRMKDIDILYTSTDIKQKQFLIQMYDIEYVYIGDLEHKKYPDAQRGFQAFNKFMRLIWNKDGSLLYQRNRGI